MTQSPSLEFKMRIAVEFDTPLAIVDGPLTRRILYVASGKFNGPGLRGIVLAGGGDWVLVRRDGSAELDIRFALKTMDDELVYFRSTGLFVASDAVATRIRWRTRRAGRLLFSDLNPVRDRLEEMEPSQPRPAHWRWAEGCSWHDHRRLYCSVAQSTWSRSARRATRPDLQQISFNRKTNGNRNLSCQPPLCRGQVRAHRLLRTGRRSGSAIRPRRTPQRRYHWRYIIDRACWNSGTNTPECEVRSQAEQ